MARAICCLGVFLLGCSGKPSPGVETDGALDAGLRAGTDGATPDGAGDLDGGVDSGVDAPVVPKVNFRIYGAVGDGVADDTAALQAALDAEAELVADPGATFLISRTVEVDQDFAHTIDWNGSMIVTTSPLNPMLLVDKRQSDGGLTSMRDLFVDGGRMATRGVELNSRVDLVNVDVARFRQVASSPAGFYINFHDDPDAYGTWNFDQCDVSDVVGASNDITGDGVGAANGYLIYWRAVPSSRITLDVRNATVSGCWGEDAQNVALFSPGIDISDSSSGTLWTNMTFLDWERRSIKGFAANNTFVECRFTDPDPGDPNLYSSNKSGLVVVGAGSGATGADNQMFESCSFRGRGYDGRVIVTDSTNVQFNNCAWNGGADLRFTSFGFGGVGDVSVCASSFGSGSTIEDYGLISYAGNDVVVLDTDNTYTETIYVNLDAAYYEERDLTCLP